MKSLINLVAFVALFCISFSSFAQEMSNTPATTIPTTELASVEEVETPIIHRNLSSVKVGVAGLALGNFNFSGEHLVAPHVSLDGTIGIIGVGADVQGNNAKGMFFKAGARYYFNKNTAETLNPLKGFYVKPEIGISTYSFDGEKFKYTTQNKVKRNGVTSVAATVNAGYQFIVFNKFTVDCSAGVGYDITNYKYSNDSNTTTTAPESNGSARVSEPADVNKPEYMYSHYSKGNKMPVTVTGSLKIGGLF